METRKILFVLSNSSTQKTINSGAETLGALKSDMRAANISYEGMTFFEGRTRTELKDDASILPVNIPVSSKGTVEASTTNDLVFMLTTQNKKIRSGALGNERTQVMEEIKAKGLNAAVTAKFGKNMTQCKTGDLLQFLADNSITKPVKPVETKKEEVVKEDTSTVTGNINVLISNAVNELAAVKVVKETLNIGLKDAKDLIGGIPSVIKGLTAEVANKLITQLTEVDATATIEGSKTSATEETAKVGPCVDLKARAILKSLLELLSAESTLDNESGYEDLLSELEGDSEEIGDSEDIIEKSSYVKESNTVAQNKSEDKLSKSELDNMFGSWCK